MTALTKVILKVLQGSLQQKEYTFAERTTCVIGRALDCNIILPDEQSHSTISRYHCLLDINPPSICIRDFGSLNGTYVNGEKIGQRDINASIKKAKQLIYPEYDLQQGDRFQLGESIFQVHISGTANNETSAAQKTIIDPLDKINLFMDKADDDSQPLMAIKGYHILKELGKGAMGVVYLAEENLAEEKRATQQPAQLAMKVMSPKIEASPKAYRQFVRETRNTQLLRHKNIVRVYDVGCYDSTFFFTTDYCEAGSVAQLISRRGGKLPLSMSLKILLQVLDGLEFAHNVDIPSIVLADGSITSASGLVHRDLKPGNILLTKVNGKIRAKISDFGLAKAFDVAGLSGRTATGISAGTPYFMPRQQVINFKFAKPEVDVWAAAATFFKMVTGRYPRKYTRESDPWLTTLKTPVSRIREYDASIPQSLASVIDKALIEQPEIYYKSAAQLKAAILNVV